MKVHIVFISLEYSANTLVENFIQQEDIDHGTLDRHSVKKLQLALSNLFSEEVSRVSDLAFYHRYYLWFYLVYIFQAEVARLSGVVFSSDLVSSRFQEYRKMCS